jgi:hypothetical protein
MRWTWITLQGAAAPALVLLFGFATSRFFGAIASIDPTGTSEVGRWAAWSLDGAVVIALGLWALFFWRLFAWERGSMEACAACQGPLGRVRDGKVYYGNQLPDYRKCYNCGKPNACAD